MTRMLFLLIFVYITGCVGQKESGFIPEGDHYYDQMFKRTGNGFTGGDATYSVVLPDGRTVWIFGDTFLGTVEEDGTRERLDPMYIRNTFVVENGDSVQTLFQGTYNQPTSLIVPQDVMDDELVTEDSVWYWPGDGFVENDELIVFLSKFKQTSPGMWGFEWIGGGMARFSLPGIELQEVIEFPEEKTGGVHFGHAVYEAEDYTYLYGLYEGQAYAARAPKGAVNSDWEYYAGEKEEWVSALSMSSPLVNEPLSEQLTVMELDGKFYLVSQLGSLSNDVWAFVSDNPYSWNDADGKKLFTIEPQIPGENIFTYNALVHPDKTLNGELLFSYNTNTFVLQDHFDNADIYRPRFLRFPYSKLK